MSEWHCTLGMIEQEWNSVSHFKMKMSRPSENYINIAHTCIWWDQHNALSIQLCSKENCKSNSSTIMKGTSGLKDCHMSISGNINQTIFFLTLILNNWIMVGGPVKLLCKCRFTMIYNVIAEIPV